MLRRARAFGEVTFRFVRRARLLSRFERFALLRVDFREGRPVAESSRAAPAFPAARFERLRAAVDFFPTLRSVALVLGFAVSTGLFRAAFFARFFLFGPDRSIAAFAFSAFVAIAYPPAANLARYERWSCAILGAMSRVVCAIDFSDASNEALRQAHAMATADGGALAVCHVVPNLHPLFPGRSVDGETAAERERSAAAAITERLRIVGRSAADTDVFVDLGSEYAAIVGRAEAWRADLIVTGSCGLTGLKRVLIGSVAARIVRYAHGPVLVARPSPESGIVVAATDLSDASLPAIDMAVQEAKRRNLNLVVVHALNLTPPSVLLGLGSPFGFAYTGPSAEMLSGVRAAAEKTIASALERFGGQGEIIVGDGDPAVLVSQLSDERAASLVVVGTRGRTGLARVTLGSVAERIVQVAPCSVLAVRLSAA